MSEQELPHLLLILLDKRALGYYGAFVNRLSSRLIEAI